VRQIWAGLLTLILLTVMAPVTHAHNLSTTAMFTRTGNELTVRLSDVYAAAVEGGRGAVSTAPPGGRQGAKAALTEVEPGAYRGTMTPPGTETFEILVEITVMNELFRGGLAVRADEELTNKPVIMVPVDRPLQHSVWGQAAFGAAALVLIAATVVALKRQRNAQDEEG